MVKLKKRVALNKINYFFKTSSLVIFFHCTSRKYLSEKIAKLLILKNHFLFSKKETENSVVKANKHNLNLVSTNEFIHNENLIVRLVKNNYAKKVLTKNKISDSSSFCIETDILDNCFQRKSQNNEKEEQFTNFEFLKKQKVKNDKVSKTSLFQGNSLLIGFKNIKALNNSISIEKILDDEKIYLLGGIYGNSILDHNQIKRLTQISGNKKVYEELDTLLQSNAFSLIYPLKKQLNFNYLLGSHYKILVLLKSLAINKISEEKNL